MNANVGMVYPVAAPVSAYTPGTSITYGTEGEGQEQTIVTVKGAIDGIRTDMNTGLTEEEITAIYNEVMEQEDEE